MTCDVKLWRDEAWDLRVTLGRHCTTRWRVQPVGFDGDTLGKGLSKRLQKLQNRSARIITHTSNETPHQEALKALGWETHEIQRTN